jgi:hypothetical protein
MSEIMGNPAPSRSANLPYFRIAHELYERAVTGYPCVGGLAVRFEQEQLNFLEIVGHMLANQMDEKTHAALAGDHLPFVVSEVLQRVVHSEFDSDCRPQMPLPKISKAAALQIVRGKDAEINVAACTRPSSRPLFVNALRLPMVHRIRRRKHGVGLQDAEQLAMKRVFGAVEIWKFHEVEYQLVDCAAHDVNGQGIPAGQFAGRLRGFVVGCAKIRRLFRRRFRLHIATLGLSQKVDQFLRRLQTELLERVVCKAFSRTAADDVIVLARDILSATDINGLCLVPVSDNDSPVVEKKHVPTPALSELRQANATLIIPATEAKRLYSFVNYGMEGVNHHEN